MEAITRLLDDSICMSGFMTNTRKLKVTPEIAARLRRGEHVLPEEIEEAVRSAEAKSATSSPSTPAKNKKSEEEEETDEPDGASPKRRVTRSQMKKKPAPPAKHVENSPPANNNVNEWIPETHLKKGPQGRRKR
jgi:hypothetical protein